MKSYITNLSIQHLISNMFLSLFKPHQFSPPITRHSCSWKSDYLLDFLYTDSHLSKQPSWIPHQKKTPKTPRNRTSYIQKKYKQTKDIGRKFINNGLIRSILSASEGHYIIVAIFEQFNISKFVQVASTAPSYHTFFHFFGLYTVIIVKIHCYIFRWKKNPNHLIKLHQRILVLHYKFTVFVTKLLFTCKKYL